MTVPSRFRSQATHSLLRASPTGTAASSFLAVLPTMHDLQGQKGRAILVHTASQAPSLSVLGLYTPSQALLTAGTCPAIYLQEHITCHAFQGQYFTSTLNAANLLLRLVCL